MKPRKWIIVVCFFILALASGLYVGKKTLEKNRNIERILVEHISPALGGTFAVENVRIGFFAVDLIGVSIVIPLQSFSLKVQDIKIGFSFLKLVASHGDIQKSINKIILVNPVLEVAFPARQKDAAVSAVSQQTFSINAFPVEHLLVKNCVIHLIDRGGKTLTVGEQLTGRLWGESEALNFELHGKLAAKKRNLFLSGVFSPVKRTQHISVRLDKARIDKPIRWYTVSVEKGSLDGVCEFSFSDTTFPYNIDAHGLVTIENGAGKIEGLAENISDIRFKALFKGNRILCDTVTARWKSVTLHGKGTAGFSIEQESRFNIKLSGIAPDMLTGVSESIRKEISGHGWIELDARRKQNTAQFTAEFTAGGLSFQKKAIRQCVGKGSFTGTSVTVDTVYCAVPGLSIGAAGLINFEKSPVVYSFELGLSGKAETFIPECGGTVTVTGDVHGLGNKPLFSLAVQGRNITWKQIDFGNPLLSVIKRGQTLHISSKQTTAARFSLSGTIDSVGNESPRLNITTTLSQSIVAPCLKTIPGDITHRLDTAYVSATISGKIPNPEITGILRCTGKKLNATGKVRLFRNEIAMPYVWQFDGEDIAVADTLFPIKAIGEIRHDTVRIKSLTALKGIAVSGVIKTGEKSTVELEIVCRDVPIDKINAFLPEDDRIIQHGVINGKARMSGEPAQLKTYCQLNLRQFSVAGITSLEADAVLRSSGEEFTVLPFVIRKDNRMICKVDTVTKKHDHLSFSGIFNNINVVHLLGTAIPSDYEIKGIVAGEFSTMDKGLPVRVHLYSPRIAVNSWNIDSVDARILVTSNGLVVEELSAADSSRSALVAEGEIPWSFLTNEIREQDTMHISAGIEGDLLATLEHSVESVVGGTGHGVVSVDFSVTADQWYFHRATATIPEGVLTVDPFLPDKVKDFTFTMRMDNKSRLHIICGGYVDKRPVTITNTHSIPKGYKPLLFGPVNCGVLQMRTPQRGIPVFVLGFMERQKGNVADIEFAGRRPFDAFTISGPVDKPKITGTWILRSLEFTFPLIEEAPFPENIVWDMDVKAGNRKVIYFYNIGRKKRRLMRFAECYLDPSSTHVKVRGSFGDGSFKVLGKIRSYRGYVFYGRNFDRDFEVGLDFAPQKMESGEGYDNLPIIWGSAETFSDSSRFDRIKLTLLVRDPETGSLSEKGRFSDMTFRVSSDFAEIPGEAELEFYREAGLNFITFKHAGKKAGEMMSSIGDQYINRYFLQRIERRLARRLGLDVFSFETSIASNYFNYLYNNPNEISGLARQWDYLAFANVGVTLGRYFLRDKVFLKWRTELIPKDLLLTPEHNIGVEYQPLDYFWVDFNYGFFRNEDDIMESNPKLRMQLRLPITKLRNYFDF